MVSGVESHHTKRDDLRTELPRARLFRRHKVDQVNFVVAGVQKAGTTALHDFLAQHPHVALLRDQALHFFDKEEHFSSSQAGLVTQPDYGVLLGNFDSGWRWRVAGEVTADYLYYPRALERVARYNPDMKVIVSLRNPVERAFAHWNMQRFKGREPLDFFDAVKEEKSRIAGAPPREARRFAYVDRGFYVQHLERFFRFFSREQMMIIKFEKFRREQRQTLHSIFSFLGVEPLSSFRSKNRNVVPYERAMNWEERVFLYNIFADDIAKLEQLLGWDCSDWKL